MADEANRDGLGEEVRAEAQRPLVADADASGVIDPDVLWSCTTCGACVQQCPVDIEHVDHIMDMRRYQVLVESNFPTELNSLFKGLETKGNPWNMSPTARMDWAKGLPFEVKQVGADVEDLSEVEWLFWVGCAGAYEDRAKKTTRAVAELLHEADVSFAVLGEGETCSGDPARRAGNEFVYAMLAMQNAETFKEAQATKVVSTCAHCFNTLKNEYEQFGVKLDVVHHTQLLNRLVREGRLTPVAAANGAVNGRTITYHDPCYLGRHNQVYSPPRELLDVIPGARFAEMPRNSERSFCCGAGGARMWMEEKIGQRINSARTDEAVATGATDIATSCPFCRVMLSDGLTAKQADGSAGENVQVLDVAQLLLESVRRGNGTGSTATGPSTGEAATAPEVSEPKAVGAAAGAAADGATEGSAGESAVPGLSTEDVDAAGQGSGGQPVEGLMPGEQPREAGPR
jgi:Fe-S oxidoreductase